MRIRPAHTWWLGVVLFTPSVCVWVITTAVLVYKGAFDCPFDRHGIAHVYLPMLAALLGCACPLLCLRLLRHGSWGHTYALDICRRRCRFCRC
jgi:hypothetical protein